MTDLQSLNDKQMEQICVCGHTESHHMPTADRICQSPDDCNGFRVKSLNNKLDGILAAVNNLNEAVSIGEITGAQFQDGMVEAKAKFLAIIESHYEHGHDDGYDLGYKMCSSELPALIESARFDEIKLASKNGNYIESQGWGNYRIKRLMELHPELKELQK